MPQWGFGTPGAKREWRSGRSGAILSERVRIPFFASLKPAMVAHVRCSSPAPHGITRRESSTLPTGQIRANNAQ